MPGEEAPQDRISATRWVGHLDMDAFFAAVEQRDNPRHRGRPVIVGGLGPRGVVSTASYEARRYGIHSAMPMAVARGRCPDGAFLAPRFARYEEVSCVVRGILTKASPLIETVSLDEAFFDLTFAGPRARDVARAAKADVERETGLTCSVGVAPNRFLAKTASELCKPNGFLVLEPDAVRETLDPLPVGRVWGVGEVTERRLRGLGLLRVRDLRSAPMELLRREFGGMGDRLHELADGIDDSPIGAESESPSLSREVTFAVDLMSVEEIEREVRDLARRVAAELVASSWLCATVRIKLRYPDFRTITRQARLPVPTDAAEWIEAVAVGLLRRQTDVADRGVRLVGVGVSSMVEADARQLELPSDGWDDRWGAPERGQSAPSVGNDSEDGAAEATTIDAR